MILQQQAKQLARVHLQALLELGVAERPRLLVREPARHGIKPLPRPGKPVRLGPPARHRHNSGQDFIGRRVMFARTGVEIGGHAATSVVDVDTDNADFGTRPMSPRPPASTL